MSGDAGMSVVEALRAAIAADIPAILVTVARARGSTPREAGAAMLVTAASTTGTIGGGALEMEAILEARRMIAEGDAVSRLDIPLGPAIGQCCGGRVELVLERAGLHTLERLRAEADAARGRAPAILLFGAGHTGQALARALQPLPFRLAVVDTRPDRLADLPHGIERVATPLPEAEVDRAEPGTAFVVMTHDHALDFLLAARALERGDGSYVGMIGSATKRGKFARYLRDTGSPADPARIVSPLGGGALRDKRPEVIAAMTAAELLLALKPLEKVCTDFALQPARCNMRAEAGDSRPDRPVERHAATSRA